VLKIWHLSVFGNKIKLFSVYSTTTACYAGWARSCRLSLAVSRQCTPVLLT